MQGKKGEYGNFYEKAQKISRISQKFQAERDVLQRETATEEGFFSVLRCVLEEKKGEKRGKVALFCVKKAFLCVLHNRSINLTKKTVKCNGKQKSYKKSEQKFAFFEKI